MAIKWIADSRLLLEEVTEQGQGPLQVEEGHEILFDGAHLIVCLRSERYGVVPVVLTDDDLNQPVEEIARRILFRAQDVVTCWRKLVDVVGEEGIPP